jgi:DNA-directed RNA polymerase specialized sigma24 family protein
MRSETRDAAYAEFVTARQPVLRRLAYAACGDWRRADDVLRAALVKLYVAWPRLEREGSEDAFVRRAVIRSDLEPHRPDARPEPMTKGHDPVLEALLALPAKQRKVVLLHNGLGLSIDETADDLRLSRSAVRMLVQRAADSLRDTLAEEAR